VSPDDARHGTAAGYLEHVKTGDYCQPCREAHAAARRSLWRKRYIRRVDRLYVDATGTRRRIRALQALGWRFVDIDEACGRRAGSAGATWSHNLVRQDKVHIDNARAIAAAYERMCMTLADTPQADRTRTMAARKGWVVPLAWDDIDDPTERPRTGIERYRHLDDVDPVAVDRAAAGDRLRLTQAERFLVVARLRAAGWSIERIQNDTCITKPERYLEARQEAS
jgi:hypothetical protein